MIGAAESRTVIAERRCKFGSRLAFEKTTGYELIRASPKRLFSDRDGGIVGECAKKCQEDARCQGCVSLSLSNLMYLKAISMIFSNLVDSNDT